METILSWGLDLIRAIQSIESPFLTAVMKGITFCGSEGAYLILLPLIFWCIDEKRGIRLGTTVIAAAWCNDALKNMLQQPRPYELDQSVGLAHEDSYGFPSGHAQGSLTFWGIVASWLRQPWGILLAAGITLLISFTRLYLGVHFPTDILGGWLVGALSLAVYFFAWPRLEPLWNEIPGRFKILLLALISFTMNAVNPEGLALSALFFGITAGYIGMRALCPFSARNGNRVQKLLRILIGFLGIAVLYLGLKELFAHLGPEQQRLFRFLRYGLVGAWLTLGAPWIFFKAGLAAPTEDSAKSAKSEAAREASKDEED